MITERQPWRNVYSHTMANIGSAGFEDLPICKSLRSLISNEKFSFGEKDYYEQLDINQIDKKENWLW